MAMEVADDVGVGVSVGVGVRVIVGDSLALAVWVIGKTVIS